MGDGLIFDFDVGSKHSPGTVKMIPPYDTSMVDKIDQRGGLGMENG